jgi:2-methylcitrate dehydratase PrpD
MTSSLTRRLTTIIGRPVDQTTRERCARHVLDWIGCAVAGAVHPAGRILADYAGTQPPGAATALAGSRVSAGEAAFCNGGLGNILEMDDVHRQAILHPGPVVIPAALAAAEETGASAARFLDAVVRGYEAEIRLGISVGPGHYAKWHNTSTCGPFGAAAATASVLDLDETRTVWALGNAATQAAGPWRCRHEPVMTKQLHTARAAQAGYVAARLAGAGFSGPEWILEGEQGFYDALCPDPAPERVTEDPDGPWKIWETSFKPWPACRHAHAAIDAALELAARHRPRPEEIAEVRILTYGDAQRFCDRAQPRSTIEAKFSLQHAVALVLTDGEPRLEGFEPAEIARADLSSLRDRCAVAVTSRYDSAYPRHYGSGVEVALRGGAVLAADVPDALGDPENPLSDARIMNKAMLLMASAGVPETVAARVADAVLALPAARDLAGLSAALADINSHLRQGTPV